jgi:hypothetical protein
MNDYRMQEAAGLPQKNLQAARHLPRGFPVYAPPAEKNLSV